MKKLFTLLVGVLLAGSAYGQSKWTTIFDQDFENNFDDQAMQYFECSESHGINRGPVRVVEDPLNAANHCLKVIVRSDAEAQAEADADEAKPKRTRKPRKEDAPAEAPVAEEEAAAPAEEEAPAAE